MVPMLDQWLSSIKRDPCPYPEFEVIDLDELETLSPAGKDYLVSLVRAARFDPRFLQDMAAYLGWENVNEHIIANLMPDNKTAKRGDFGEALMAGVLTEFHGYHIPIPKLRFKFTGGQSLPSTDTLALKTNSNGEIVEICFMESKLRTSQDDYAATSGYSQLEEDYNCKLPDILTFVAARLHEQNHALFPPFALYMKNRLSRKDNDAFRLGLCYDSEVWREKALENMQAHGVKLPNFSAHVICVDNLRIVTDEIFAELGLTEVSDDE